MSVIFAKPSLRQRLTPMFKGYDPWLLLAIFLLAACGLVIMYSAGFDHGTRFVDHGRNMLIGAALLFMVSQIPPQRIMALAVPIYTLGVLLLIAVALFGITKKGATRWLNLGVVVAQPSEIMKIGMPLMLAWWFQRGEGKITVPDFMIALILLALPVGLIAKQPDLGTSLLVASAGLYVIFFAGLSWKLIIPLVLVSAAGMTALVWTGEQICEPQVEWPIREYQKNRVCTLLDPTKDPLGKGFHTIQGMIAIGSGGIYGKGFMKGTQTHLEFIPERTTDFIFAAFSEEFGLVGCLILLICFTFLIMRGLIIALFAPTLFTRLLAGAITLTFFTYAFVNMGMVSGILPVVGVPLPFISYGGTAMVTLGLGLGILMSIARDRRLNRS